MLNSSFWHFNKKEFLVAKSIKVLKTSKQKGMASIEAIIAVYMFVTLIAFSLGFFGVVHTGIINSIAARTYAFDTFENRTYLIYHRGSSGNAAGRPISHKAKGYRLHTITSEDARVSTGGDGDFEVTERYLAFSRNPNDSDLNQPNENDARGHLEIQQETKGENILERGGRRPRFNPVWVKAGYGICLNASCGG